MKSCAPFRILACFPPRVWYTKERSTDCNCFADPISIQHASDDICTLWGACSVGMFCFVSEVPVINWAAQLLQYQPNSRWNMSIMIYKTSRLSGRLIVYTSRRGTEYILQSTLSFRRVSYHSRTNCKDSNSWNHFWECRHLLFFKEGKFGVVWALGGRNSNY